MEGERSIQCWAFSVVSSGNSGPVSWRFTIVHHLVHIHHIHPEKKMSLFFKTTKFSQLSNVLLAGQATICSHHRQG